MNIICACVNSKFIHSSLAPWCLKAGVTAFSPEDCSVKVLESTINGDLDAFSEKILNEHPDIISFSCYIWNIKYTLDLCKLIKGVTECKIILGGPEVCYRPDEILKNYNYIDYILTGEGEWCFSEFVNCIYNNNSLDKVHGLSFRENNAIVSIPERFYTDTPPSPYCEEYFASLNDRIAYMESSRGCPFNCSYCLSGRISPLRYFDFDFVTKNIINLSQSGTKTIKFIDRTFNADPNKANRILTFIKDNYGNAISNAVCFHFEISADILRTDTLEIFKNMPSGAVQLEIGIQSFNKATLNAINRRVNIEKLIYNIEQLLSFNNIHIHTDLIAGLPFEDIKSFIYGFDKAFALHPHMLQLGFLKVLSGTKMQCQTDDFGCKYSSLPPYEFQSTKWISEEDKNILKQCETALDKLYNSGRFLYTVEYLLEATYLSPFELFRILGKEIHSTNLSLKELTAIVYDTFSGICDKDVLREKICCDVISTGADINLPDNLKRVEQLYKRNKKYYTELFNENIKIVILNTCNKVYIVKKSDSKDLYGRYSGNFYEIKSD